MPRRYRRDARGRFASSGKATSKLRPGELMNANARPVNTTGRFRPQASSFGTDRKQNVDRFIADALKTGQFRDTRTLRTASRGAMAEVHVTSKGSRLSVNSRSKWFADPVRQQRELRRQGWFSTSDPRGLVAHEVAHAKNRHVGPSLWPLGMTTAGRKIAGRVSQYAKTNPHEFVAEVAAGLKTGRKYDREVMATYRAATGRPDRPPARRRSRLSRKPKPSR
jgi:hypothetical protein